MVVVMVMIVIVIIILSEGIEFCFGDIFHSANRTGACHVAAAALAVHRANIS